MSLSVEILSRKDAEVRIAAGNLDGAAIISFYSPKTKHTPFGYAPLDYTDACQRVFHIGLHDIDLEILGDFGLTFETYFPERHDVARFILAAVKDGCPIICQCDYGQSRSAACAAAIWEFFERSGIRIFADYRYYPNQLVFNKILAALKDVAAEQAP